MRVDSTECMVSNFIKEMGGLLDDHMNVENFVDLLTTSGISGDVANVARLGNRKDDDPNGGGSTGGTIRRL